MLLSLIDPDPWMPCAKWAGAETVGKVLTLSSKGTDLAKIGGQVRGILRPCINQVPLKCCISTLMPAQVYCKNCRCFLSTLVPVTEALVGSDTSSRHIFEMFSANLSQCDRRPAQSLDRYATVSVRECVLCVCVCVCVCVGGSLTHSLAHPLTL